MVLTPASTVLVPASTVLAPASMVLAPASTVLAHYRCVLLVPGVSCLLQVYLAPAYGILQALYYSTFSGHNLLQLIYSN